MDTPEELHSIVDFVRWVASRFEAAGLRYGHGTDTALDEAAALVLHTLHLPPDLHPAYFPARLTAMEKQAIVARVAQRIDDRVPLPYITHEAWFAGLPFYVDERVLVPRSPFAELIETGFEPWVDPDAVESVVDVGTGSGCIAIATALALPAARVDAVDVSADALAVARRNIERHGVGDRVTALQSDLLAEVPADRRYDLILANPPYVDTEGMSDLPPEYRHEPSGGLAGGVDGLDLVRPLLHQAAERLTTDGVLFCEVGYSWPAVETSFPDLELTWLTFERGGEGVFVVTAEALRRAVGPTARP